MIKEGYNNCVQEHVVVEIAIWSKSHSSTRSNGEGIQILSCCIPPDLKHTNMSSKSDMRHILQTNANLFSNAGGMNLGCCHEICTDTQSWFPDDESLWLWWCPYFYSSRKIRFTFVICELSEGLQLNIVNSCPTWNEVWKLRPLNFISGTIIGSAC